MEIFIILLLVIFSFSLAIFFGPPYLPIFNNRLAQIIELGQLKPGDRLIDLGCGDGRLLRYAAKRGIQVIGYEINPILFFICWLTTRRYSQNVTLIFGNFWQKDFVEAEVVYVFLLPRLMTKLAKKLDDYSYKPVKLISFSFIIPNRKIIKKMNNLFLYLF